MIKIDNLFPKVDQNQLQLAGQGLEALMSRKDLGFTQLLDRPNLWESARNRAQELRESGVRRVALLGMGGSSLGPKTLWESFGCWQGELDEFHFFDNLDSVSFFRRLEQLGDPTQVHFILISKSGTTLETLSMADYVDQHLRQKGSSLAAQCTTISELRSNPLSDWARANQVSLLEIPEDVGGRYSVLTPVGLLPAALMGCSLDEIRDGMKSVLDQHQILTQIIAAGLASIQRGDQALYFWPYAQGLETFGFWFQQLWAESLGKKLDRQGKPAPTVPVPIPSLAPRDQHSTLQQVVEGHQPRWVWLLRDSLPVETGPELDQSSFAGGSLREKKKMSDLVAAQADATEGVLTQEGIPTLALSLPGLKPKTIGGLFLAAELVVGGMGEVMGINAFDQPGVELGKKLTKELLSKDR